MYNHIYDHLVLFEGFRKISFLGYISFITWSDSIKLSYKLYKLSISDSSLSYNVSLISKYFFCFFSASICYYFIFAFKINSTTEPLIPNKLPRSSASLTKFLPYLVALKIVNKNTKYLLLHHCKLDQK